MPALME